MAAYSHFVGSAGTTDSGGSTLPAKVAPRSFDVRHAMLNLFRGVIGLGGVGGVAWAVVLYPSGPASNQQTSTWLCGPAAGRGAWSTRAGAPDEASVAGVKSMVAAELLKRPKSTSSVPRLPEWKAYVR